MWISGCGACFLASQSSSGLNSSLQSQKMLFLNHYAVLLLVHPMDEALLISEAAPVLNSRYKHLKVFVFLLEVRRVTNLTDTLASIIEALTSESFPLALLSNH